MRHFDKNAVGSDHWLMQLGTLSGNPVASAAGLKTLEILRRPNTYETLRSFGSQLMNMFQKHLSDAGIAHQIVGDETLFDIVFTDVSVRNYRNVLKADSAANMVFNKILRANGIFKSPGKTYPSLALTKDDLELTNKAIQTASMMSN